MCLSISAIFHINTGNLSLRNGPPQPYAPLPTVQSLLLHQFDLRALLHNLFTFRQDQLDVARI